MPITIQLQTDKRISVEEFIDFVNREIDLETPESIATGAEMFYALAQDKDVVSEKLNARVVDYLSGGALMTNGPQSVVLGIGRGFFIRANIWLPLSSTTVLRSHEERLYSYGNTHDHNFSFMTVGYFGPGYTTDLYEYDVGTVKGHVGEVVDLKDLGRTDLPCGKVMVYREKCDVHTQYPPESLSISLNLMVTSPRSLAMDQYFFDAKKKCIIDMPEFASIHKRASIVALAGAVGNANTIEILESLLKAAPCRRVREAALDGLAKLPVAEEGDKARLFELAANDSDSLVRARAHIYLQGMN